MGSCDCQFFWKKYEYSAHGQDRGIHHSMGPGQSLFGGKPSYQPMSGGSLQMVYYWDYMAYQMIPGFIEKHGRIIASFGKLMVNYIILVYPRGKLT